MLCRAIRTIPSNVLIPAYIIPSRGMVTEKQLKDRIKSVISIQKITSAMKMVAAVKLRTSQVRLEIAREFSQDIEKIWEVENEDTEDLVVAIAADSGLCGAVNSNIVRGMRDDIKDGEQKILILGERARPGLERMFSNRFTTTLSALANNKVMSFQNAAVMADIWLERKFDKTLIYFNYFKSMISYITTRMPFLSFEKSNEDLSSFYPYEIEGDNEVMQNLYEFRGAVSLFHCLAENETSVLSSRMNAMDNSSKNASEMIDDLSLKMNRARQAKITTELIEIISGAQAVDEGN